ncbi:hypothetical protein [Cryptosporangium sp. NPDC051539]|uniref:hypothetical protein n=1 Tax=Cryptosporangium sp. NPDC051539 TaxID=3363962 RepID=UPI003790F12B
MLILVLAALVFFAVRRWQIAIRGQRLADPHPPTESWFPLSPRRQVRRATDASTVHVRNEPGRTEPLPPAGDGPAPF